MLYTGSVRTLFLVMNVLWFAALASEGRCEEGTTPELSPAAPTPPGPGTSIASPPAPHVPSQDAHPPTPLPTKPQQRLPASGEASPAPAAPSPASDPEGTTGLLLDVSRIVRAFENEGWFLDSEAYREIQPTMLQSVCRVTPTARAGALATLTAARPVDPRRLYEAAGSELTDAVEDALTKERQYQALKRAVDSAEADCPFWIPSEHGYRGRQTVRNRWVLHFENGGLVQLRQQQGRYAIGGGGNSRLLVGRGLGSRWSLLAGLELGGGALIRSTDSGQFTINYLPAIPVVVRHRQREWLFDLELAPIGLFQSHDTRVSYGGRVGLMVGLAVLNQRGFLPWAGVAVVGEHLFDNGVRESAQFLRGGVRVGIRWPQ